MKEITELKEIHDIELGILDHIVSLCKENNLRYYLIGGTLLGAVRHKGFIPWDDDIDITMPRPDYDKLAEIMISNPDKRYKLFRIEDDNDYNVAFMKISDTYTIIKEKKRQMDITGLGAFVDIFPMDGTSSDMKEAIKLQNSCYMWAATVGHALPNYAELTLSEKILRFFQVLLFKKNRRKKFEKIVARYKKYPFDESEYVVSTFGIRGKNEILKRENFDSYIKAPFEDRIYNIPVGYDTYLKNMYNDYMQLPPENERHLPHSLRFFWKDQAN